MPKAEEQTVNPAERRLGYIRQLATEVMGWELVEPAAIEDFEARVSVHHLAVERRKAAPIFWVAEESAAIIVAGVHEEPIGWDPFESMDSAFDVLRRVRATWKGEELQKLLRALVKFGAETARDEVGLTFEERQQPVIPFFLEAHHVAWAVLQVKGVGRG